MQIKKYISALRDIVHCNQRERTEPMITDFLVSLGDVL
jgi:hypothetical protein